MEKGFDEWIKKNSPQQIVTETDEAVYIDGFKVGFVASVHSEILGKNQRMITLKFVARDFKQNNEPLNSIYDYQKGPRQ